MDQIPLEENPVGQPPRTGLRDPHTPSHKQALIFFAVTILIAGGLAVWEMFLNRGTLVLSSDVAFHADVGGESIFCEHSPCALKLKPKNYTVSFTRDGYFTDTQQIEVQRFTEAQVSPTFKLIPTFSRLKDNDLPTIFPLSSLALAPTSLPNFPTNASRIAFNSTASQAIVATDEALFLYDTASKTIGKLTIGKDIPFAWAGNALLFLANTKEGSQILWNYGTEQDTPLVTFERPLKNPMLWASSDAKYALLSELDEEQKTTIYYLIDLTTRARKRLNIPERTSFANFTGDGAVFVTSGKTPDDTATYNYLSFADDKMIPLPHAVSDALAIKDGTFYYFTNFKTEGGSGAPDISIEDAINQISDNLSKVASPEEGDATPAPKKNPQEISDVTYFLTELIPATGTTKTITSLVLKEGSLVTEMTVMKNIIVVRAGKAIYQLKE